MHRTINTDNGMLPMPFPSLSTEALSSESSCPAMAEQPRTTPSTTSSLASSSKNICRQMACKRLFSAVSPESLVLPTELIAVDFLELLDEANQKSTAMRTGLMTKNNFINGSSSALATRRLSLLGAMATPSTSSLSYSPRTTDSSSSVVGPPERKRRRVCFALPDTCPSYIQQEVEPDCTMTQQEQQSYWYSREDLKAMKREAKRSCQLRYGELEHALSKAYNKTASIAASDVEVNDENQDVHDLRTLPGFEAQRGLERWSSKMQMLSRCVTIVQAKTEVMLEQVNQQLSTNSVSAADHHIAKAIRPASLKSARYARLLALADAQVAAEINSDDEGN